ncbi:putative ribonuclease H-like domain-containing protein [Tanacetum coccineum]|uniref:Ribonuclease H-like domain-containing protein n=1 Tax=Tanacetum coccineum TaxID=301880 RepID=A0ABQ4X839_9ASTR
MGMMAVLPSDKGGAEMFLRLAADLDIKILSEKTMFDLSTPSVMYPKPVEEVKPLTQLTGGEMHAVPPSITELICPPHTSTSVPSGSRNSPAFDTAGGSDPAANRNRPAVNSAGRPNPAGWSKRPAPVSAGRQVSAGYTRFKTDKPQDTQETNITAEELAKLQRQEYEAKDAAARYVLPAGSDPAGGNPAGNFRPAGSYEPAGQGNSAVSTSVSADFIPVHAAESTLPPGQSLGSSENTTRFPVPSNVCKDQLSSGIFTSSSYDDDFSATLTNLAPAVEVNPVPTKRVNTIHPSHRFIEDLASSSSDKSKAKNPNIAKALEDSDWVAAMQEEMQQFINQKVWTLVPLPAGKNAIGTKWILKNKRDARGIVVRNKARLVAQGHRQEEGIDYDECLLYEKLKKKCMSLSPKAFEEPYITKHVYKVVKACNGLHQAPRPVYVDDIIFGSTNKAWCAEFEVLMKGEFEMSAMGEMTFFLGLQVKQLPDGTFISQDRYVKDMLTKFDMESVRTATTPYEAAKTKLKDETDPPVNVHLYRSMIGSLMYLTASRPDIMFAVSACSRHQVTPLTSHLNAVKKIFKYLKGQPKLGLWYPKDSPFQLEAYSDSDYAGSHGDRKSTTGGCQFLGRRLISWQCKKQTIVATSSTEAEYVAAASCCAQVLWIQNQLLDYGFNFMNTKIFIDNQSTICIVKNPVFHQRTKHIEIRHHFIRDANEKNLIQVLKIHTDDNVADLLTKAFDGPRFAYLVVHIGMVVNTAASWCVFLLFAWFLLLVDSFCWLNTFMLLELFLLSIHLFMLLNCFCCAQFDIAGWLVSAIVHYISLLWLSPNHAGAITLYLLNE